MRTTIFVFSKQGMEMGLRVRQHLNNMGHQVTNFGIEEYVDRDDVKAFRKISDVIEQEMKICEVIIFISASGIAVRAIAPHIKNKVSDPAVLVMDEKGHFVIPILSGHVGGANQLAEILAKSLSKEGTNCIPVITAATDSYMKFSVDKWAKRQGLGIIEMDVAKEISDMALHQEIIPIYVDDNCEKYIRKVPKGCSRVKGMFRNGSIDNYQKGIYICSVEKVKKKSQPFAQTLHLVPRKYVLGIGCRKEISYERVENCFLETLREMNIYPQEIGWMTTIDIKRNEPALLELSARYHLEMISYTSKQLQQAEGDFDSSEFVKKITGVDNASERSAMIGNNYGKKVYKKRVQDGITISVYEKYSFSG